MGRRSGTASKALVRRLGAVGVWAGDASGLPVVGKGKSRPRRRSPPGTPPGAMAKMLRSEVLSASDLHGPIRQVVRASQEAEVAAPGLGDRGRGRLSIGIQERGDDGATGDSQDIGMSSRRDMAASSVRRNGEGFSLRPSNASRRGAV